MDAYETTIYTAVLISGSFLACLTLYFVLSVLKHQRKHVDMQRRYFLDEIKVLEKERSRIARDLHDELAPCLSLTKFQIDSLGDSDNTQLTKKASRNLENVMLRLGEIAADLNASKLVEKGLAFAVQNVIMDIEQLTPMKVEFVYEVRTPINPESAIHLYRIVQEILHNAVKHAEASHLLVHFKERRKKIWLSVTDNGKGINAWATEKISGGIGIMSIRSRTGMLGGRMQLISEPGKGTHYLIEVPTEYYG